VFQQLNGLQRRKATAGRDKGGTLPTIPGETLAPVLSSVVASHGCCFMKLDKILIYLLISATILWGWTLKAEARDSREKFMVAIDIGHTKSTGGALSAHGIYEYYFNQKVAFLLLVGLHKNGFKKSFIINANGDDISLVGRTIEAKNRRADLFISIHHDSVEPEYLSQWVYQGRKLDYCDLFKGFSVFVADNKTTSKRSYLLATLLGTELLQKGFHPTLHHWELVMGGKRKLLDQKRGIYEYNKLAVLRTAAMPAILLECGVIKNRNEEKCLNDDYRNKLVTAIIAAIIQYHAKVPSVPLQKSKKAVR